MAIDGFPFIDGLPNLIAWRIFPWQTVSHNQRVSETFSPTYLGLPIKNGDFPWPNCQKETIPWPRRQRDQREDRGAALSQQRSHDGAASVAVSIGKVQQKKRRQP